jgi:hypothetical protein
MPAEAYDPAADLVHGAGWNSAARWGGWSWNEPRRGDHFRTCSFCGSIHPEDLAAELGSGVTVDWADWKYGWPHKLYANGIRPRDPGMLHVFSRATRSRPDRGAASDWIADGDLTDEQRAVIAADHQQPRDDEDRDCWWMFRPKTELHAKFYTVHLGDPAIGQDVKDAVQRASGLKLTWLDDGRVSWEPWQDSAPADDTAVARDEGEQPP